MLSYRRTAIAPLRAGATVTTARDGDTSTLAYGHTVGDNFLGILVAADSSGAVAKTVAEVGVGAQALQVALVAVELLGLLSGHHVVGTGLL